MPNLTKAHKELFRRTDDETYESMEDLYARCKAQEEASVDRWCLPDRVQVQDNLRVTLGDDGAFSMNDWSFTQLCRMAGVSKDTVNILTERTASTVFRETLPRGGNKPLQFLTTNGHLRSLHSSQYTRLWNTELLDVIREFGDFQPPQKAATGGTGLYCGEQDIFCFLIDPAGWVEIGEQAFAPGFFVWNSEVGRRTLGIETFWFQAARFPSLEPLQFGLSSWMRFTPQFRK